MESTDQPSQVQWAFRSGLYSAGVIARAATLTLAMLLPACEKAARLSVISQGEERWATVDRPTRTSSGRRPLLIILHAALFSGDLARDELDLLARADREGVVLAFPDAEALVWNDGSLSRALPGSFSPAVDDLGFIDALIDTLVADGTADPAAIHLAGISSGGMMALRYACSRANRLVSVAVFLATMPLEADQECRPTRPLNLLMVAGTADPVVRWTGEVMLGGMAFLQQRMSVPASFEFWRRANRCAGLTAVRPLPRRGESTQPDVLLHPATGCAGGVSTVLYEVRGGGHRLSVGDDWTLLRLLGRATPDIEPGALLLDFALDPRRIPELGQGGPMLTERGP